MRIGLVGCVKGKLMHRAPARELYTSPLFMGRRRWVESTCDRWFILSAMHGLVDPATVLSPYDVTLNDLGYEERRRWSAGVLADLEQTCGPLRTHTFEIHAGDPYVRFGLEEGLIRSGAAVERPSAGLSLGEQLQFYSGTPGIGSASAAAVLEPRRTVLPSRERTARASRVAGGKYESLGRHLHRVGPTTMSFSEIDTLVGGLPESAYRWRPWWANDSSHVQARAWLEAGLRVIAVDSHRRTVTFGKAL